MTVKSMKLCRESSGMKIDLLRLDCSQKLLIAVFHSVVINDKLGEVGFISAYTTCAGKRPVLHTVVRKEFLTSPD